MIGRLFRLFSRGKRGHPRASWKLECSLTPTTALTNELEFYDAFERNQHRLKPEAQQNRHSLHRAQGPPPEAPDSRSSSPSIGSPWSAPRTIFGVDEELPDTAFSPVGGNTPVRSRNYSLIDERRGISVGTRNRRRHRSQEQESEEI